MPVYRNSRVLNIADRSSIAIEFNIENIPNIIKYRLFLFETMLEAEASDIRIGIDTGGLAPQLEYYPSKQFRTQTLERLNIYPPEEAIKNKSRVLMHIPDVHTQLTQENMLFAINQEYCSQKDANGDIIGWLPPSPIQIILPSSFPLNEIQRPFMGIYALAPKNPDTSIFKPGKVPVFGKETINGSTNYYTNLQMDTPINGNDELTPGVLHYTVPTYSQASYISNHSFTEHLYMTFHPRMPFFIVEPQSIVCLSGAMETDIVAVSANPLVSVPFTIGFGVSKS